MNNLKFVSTGALARTGIGCAKTIRKACEENPGFAVRIGKSWRIPLANLHALHAGLTVEEIAARARSRNAQQG